MQPVKPRKKRSPLSEEAKVRMTEKRRATIAAKNALKACYSENLAKQLLSEQYKIGKILLDFQGYGVLNRDKAKQHLINMGISSEKTEEYFNQYSNYFYEKDDIDVTNFNNLCSRLSELYKVQPYAFY